MHIVPMGYEIDRIELPLKEIGADRVYLITDENEKEVGLRYLKELDHRIKKIINAKDFKVLSCPMWDFQSLMSLICELVRTEKLDGNFVYINVSSGSKLSAISGTLASLMYGAIPYYAQAETYYIDDSGIKGREIRGITSGIRKILQIPSYTIEKPPDELIKALEIISEKGGRISQKECIFELEKRKLIENAIISGRGQRTEVTKKGYAKAKRQFFEKLEEKGWAVKKGKGRSSYIEITNEGKNTFETFIKVAGIEKKQI